MSEPKKNVMAVVGSGMKGGAKKSLSTIQAIGKDFANFLNKGSVVDLAIGVVMGAAFTAVVGSLVKDLISPIIALASPDSTLPSQYVLLRCPKNLTSCSKGSFSSLAVANLAGAVTWNYGSFIESVINFLVISIVVFFLVKAYTAAFRKPAPIAVKECVYCCMSIPLLANRCPHCTSGLSDKAETE